MIAHAELSCLIELQASHRPAKADSAMWRCLRGSHDALSQYILSRPIQRP